MKTKINPKDHSKKKSRDQKVAQRKGKTTNTPPIKDHRPEAIRMQKLQESANNSHQVKQLKALQDKANDNSNNNKVAQLQKKANQKNTPNQTIQKKENKTGLPDKLKSGIENISGHSMDDVKVHYNSDKPAQLQAHAYAQGTDIHLGAGQEKHLPHEAWHVVQQKQGRVKPTMQLKGKVNINDDKGLEKEADVMGEKTTKVTTTNSQNKPLVNNSIAEGIVQGVWPFDGPSITSYLPKVWPFAGSSILPDFFGTSGSKKKQRPNKSTKKQKPKSKKNQGKKNKTNKRTPAPHQPPTLSGNRVKSQVEYTGSEARKALRLAREMDPDVIKEKEYTTFNKKRKELSEQLEHPTQEQLRSKLEEKTQLLEDIKSFKVWFSNRRHTHWIKILTQKKEKLTQLTGLLPYLGDTVSNEFIAKQKEVNKLLAEPVPDFEKDLQTMNTKVEEAAESATKIITRYSTPNMAAVIADLRVATTNFNAEWVAHIIHKTPNLVTAKTVLNYAGQAAILPDFQALIGVYKPDVIIKAKSINATSRLIAMLQDFHLEAIPKSNGIVLAPSPDPDLVTENKQRLCSFHWEHFLNPHLSRYATSAVLKARNNQTSFWAPTTTTGNISSYLKEAIEARSDINSIYRAIKRKETWGFNQKYSTIHGIRVRTGIEINNGFISITQFYPDSGPRIKTFTSADSVELGELLAYKLKL